MPRQKRFFLPGSIYHIIARGNKKEKIFLEEKDYNFFLFLLQKNWEKKPLKIFAFTLMSNHFHILAQATDEPLSKYFQPVLTTYAIYFNRKYQKTGHVFEDRFKSYLIESDDYLWEAFRYVLLNPLRAGLVLSLSSYPWSSFYYFLNPQKALPFMDFSLFTQICPNGLEDLQPITNFLVESLVKEEFWPEDLDGSIRYFHLQYLAKKICNELNLSYAELLTDEYKRPVVNAQVELALRAKEQYNIELKQTAEFLGKSYNSFLRTIRKNRKK
ncbi:transposase [Carboxydothermus islandicus]|uniref:Transposase n=1 Tax=Carboxydothermus islandicus TaxID=661089 RepID=A0A1L8D2Z6_9THEO|nr:transposase [Carboxydothermus islandicus]GAV25566.1 transposase [Carboxydothermus islandicus]